VCVGGATEFAGLAVPTYEMGIRTLIALVYFGDEMQ
jgi:hypothetical protein